MGNVLLFLAAIIVLPFVLFFSLLAILWAFYGLLKLFHLGSGSRLDLAIEKFLDPNGVLAHQREKIKLSRRGF